MAGDPKDWFAAGRGVPAGRFRAEKRDQPGVSKAWRVNAKRGGWPHGRLYDTKRWLSRGSFVYDALSGPGTTVPIRPAP